MSSKNVLPEVGGLIADYTLRALAQQAERVSTRIDESYSFVLSSHPII